jgi:Ribosomal protein L5
MAEKLNPRMQVLYAETIRPKMVEMFGYKNMMEVPKIDKIVLNMGVGDATQDKKKVDQAAGEMALIAGQKPVICKAKKSVAARSRCAASACMNSLTASSRSRCRAFAISVACRPSPLMVAVIMPAVSRNS